MYVPLEREGTSPILLDCVKLFSALHWKHSMYSNAVVSFILQFCVWWGNLCTRAANIHLCYYFVKEVDENDSTDFSPIVVAKLGNLNLSTVSNNHQKYNQFSIQVLQLSMLSYVACLTSTSHFFFMSRNKSSRFSINFSIRVILDF